MGSRGHHCPFCNGSFLTEQHLFNHLFTHTREKPFPCSICERTFCRDSARKIHLAKAHSIGKSVVKCDKCAKCFGTAEILERHVGALHSSYSDRPFGCELCDKRYMTKSKCLQHLICHTGEKPFKCEICGKSFSFISALNKHVKSHRAPEFKCGSCDKAFSLAGNLRRHQKYVHDKSRRTHVCNVCTKAFYFGYELEVHQRVVHSDERPFQCPICFVRYKSKFSLNLHHQTVHTTEKRHKCPHCPKTTASKGSMRYHLYCHTGERPYICLFCPYRTRSSGSLSNHIKLHTKEKPYFCQLCDKCYCLKPLLDDHFRTRHTLERPFKCGPECGKAFGSMTRLMDHQRREICRARNRTKTVKRVRKG